MRVPSADGSAATAGPASARTSANSAYLLWDSARTSGFVFAEMGGAWLLGDCRGVRNSLPIRPRAGGDPVLHEVSVFCPGSPLPRGRTEWVAQPCSHIQLSNSRRETAPVLCWA